MFVDHKLTLIRILTQQRLVTVLVVEVVSALLRGTGEISTDTTHRVDGCGDS